MVHFIGATALRGAALGKGALGRPPATPLFAGEILPRAGTHFRKSPSLSTKGADQS